MPKTTSQRLLKRYPPLAAIPDEEWDDFFPHTRAEWSAEDDEYLSQWYGHDHVITLSYAFGRTPWTVYDRAIRLGLTHSDKSKNAKLAV